MKKSTGVSKQVNDFLQKHALEYSRRELVEVIKQKFNFVISKQGIAQREERLGISRENVVEKHRHDPQKIEKTKTVEETVEEDRRIKRLSEERSGYKKRYEHLLSEYEKVLVEVDAARAIAQHSEVFPIEPSRGSGDTEAVAVAVASDWHVEEIVQPHTVNNLNKYNPDIAKKRATRFFQLIERMVKKERNAVNIKTLVLWLGGDFISGNIHESLKITCDMSPVSAAMYATELIRSGITFLLEQTDLDLVVPCSIGNHSRMTAKVITGDEAGNSLEWFIYGALAQAFEGEKRVRFILSESYLNIVPILGLKVRFHHGHAVKFGGGVGGLTIPLNKAIFRWNQTDKVDLDVLGHFHQYTSMRQFVVNGSLIGTTDYGLRSGFENEPPTQAFFLIDQRRGKTVSIPLFCGER